MSGETQAKTQKTISGVVVSDKMQNTIVVAVTTKVPHKLYKKYVKKTTKFHVDDQKGLAKVGDTVKIAQTRPVSKTKFWTLVEVLPQHNV